MTNKELSIQIIELVGGSENVRSAAHCMTRLRLKINNPDAVQMDALKELEGVLGVVDSDTLQVVIGPGKAKKVYDEVMQAFNIVSGGDVDNPD